MLAYSSSVIYLPFFCLSNELCFVLRLVVPSRNAFVVSFLNLVIFFVSLPFLKTFTILISIFGHGLIAVVISLFFSDFVVPFDLAVIVCSNCSWTFCQLVLLITSLSAFSSFTNSLYNYPILLFSFQLMIYSDFIYIFHVLHNLLFLLVLLNYSFIVLYRFISLFTSIHYI